MPHMSTVLSANYTAVPVDCAQRHALWLNTSSTPEESPSAGPSGFWGTDPVSDDRNALLRLAWTIRSNILT